jgi:cyclic pyranopterin monophosphate synthase
MSDSSERPPSAPQGAEGEPGRRLTHVDASGAASMVDVSAKPDSVREATAEGVITMQRETLAAICANALKKGDVFSVARIAGIMGAKRTAELVPLCHPVPLHDVQVAVSVDEDLPGLRVRAVAKTAGKTGVEMEAIVAVTLALVTVYDMAKAMDRGMVIGQVVLLRKSGGVHGDYARLDAVEPGQYPG